MGPAATWRTVNVKRTGYLDQLGALQLLGLKERSGTGIRDVCLAGHIVSWLERGLTLAFAKRLKDPSVKRIKRGHHPVPGGTFPAHNAKYHQPTWL